MSVGALNILDGVVLAIGISSSDTSTMTGFVCELLRMASIVLSFMFGSWCYRYAAPLFKDVVKSENLALFFGFFIVFLGTLLVGSLAIWLITRFVKVARLQWFDRLLGAAFGFIRGWVLASILLLGLTSFG